MFWSDGNEGILHIPQGSSIIGASPSDRLVSYLRHSLVGRRSYPSTKMLSVYSIAQTNWANLLWCKYYCMVPQLSLKQNAWKKVTWKLHKDTACCLEQILEAAPYKTVASV